MVYKMNCTAVREAAAARTNNPSTPIFRMKKTSDELRRARELLKENENLALNEEQTSQVLRSDDEDEDDALEYAHGRTLKVDMSLAEPTILDHSDFDLFIKTKNTTIPPPEDCPMTEEGDVDEDDDDDNEDDQASPRSDPNPPPAYVVSHPWHIVDYHLYLCSTERGQTQEARRQSMYVLYGFECRPLPYEEFAEDRGLMSQCFPGDMPQLLFGLLPIADRRHFADRNPSFDGRNYVLGLDYDCKTLYARHFDWFPHDLGDIWCIWEEGINVYTVTVPDLMQILDTSLGKGEMHVGMGILSSSEYCLAMTYDDDPGLEIIIATLWCQWLLDFSDILFKPETGSLSEFQAKLRSHVDQGRLILQRASYRAWFAVRDGYSKEQYKVKTTINQYTNDLYTFEKSAEDGSLKGRSWAAPGLETCNQLRHNHRMQRKRNVEQRLEDLFVAPNFNVDESQEAVLQGILAGHPKTRYDTPKTPSPKTRYTTPTLSENFVSPGSPEIVTPTTQPYGDFEISECYQVPLLVLLNRAAKLVQAHPELDTLANRDRFGDLLTGMSAAVQRPGLGYDIHPWKVEKLLEQGSLTCRHSPSPVFE
ncbi:hypothetical protein BJY01DRAFT_227015 [Aspergillus pseudoustus]|uniref:Aminotransferase-like plant mobile domain-containing protein n=1 Tax=Aspergillus pseudoustus TaxID=1810923 RepID=A0ABR4ISJ3_9EURO